MARDETLPEQPVLTLVAAKKIVAAAAAEAEKNGWRVVIAVVDAGGHLIALERLDEAQVASVEIARQKAWSAAAFKRPTKAWEEALAGGRQGVLRLEGAVPSEGGVPLVYRGRLVGAVGVSGAQPWEDGQVARAGAEALG